METHYLDRKETIRLPSERSVMRSPSISAIAALDATLAIAKNAILCDNPTMQELMDIIDEEDSGSLHHFCAHNIVNLIDRLRLTIFTYNKQIEEYREHLLNKNLPF